MGSRQAMEKTSSPLSVMHSTRLGTSIRRASTGSVPRPASFAADAPRVENPLTVPPPSMHVPLVHPMRSAFGASVSKTARRYYSTPPREPAAASTEAKPRKKTTLLDLQKKHKEGEPITMITCYDYPTATIVDKVGVDIVLIGDSCGMVVHGHDSTLPVSVDEIVSHCQAVRRGAPNTFIVADMPFGSFEVDASSAVQNAITLIKGGADAVKLEGGTRMAAAAQAIVNAGVLVMGHIGLTPQSAAAMGGFRVQGKSCGAAQSLLEDAKALENAGCFCTVIEGVPSVVAEYVTKNTGVPTIGIGAGKATSGQVLVLHDMIGLNPGRTPKFCKQYSNVSAVIEDAIQQYVTEVSKKEFPSKEYTYLMPKGEAQKIRSLLEDPQPAASGPEEPPAPGGVARAAAATYDRSKARKLVAPTKKIAVIGGGAMGSFVGACLARQQTNSVWMVSDWTDHVQKITNDGLQLTGVEGGSSTLINTIRATSNLNSILEEEGKMDLAIILVKSPNTEIAAKKAAKLVDENHGVIMTLQNGVGNRETILTVFDAPDRVVGGVTAHGAMMLGSVCGCCFPAHCSYSFLVHVHPLTHPRRATFVTRAWVSRRWLCRRPRRAATTSCRTLRTC